METTFKYTTKKWYEHFYNSLHQSLDRDPIKHLEQSPEISTMLSHRFIPKGSNEKNALEIMECLLYIFEEYEKYETCQSIINTWPELKINA